MIMQLSAYLSLLSINCVWMLQFVRLPLHGIPADVTTQQLLASCALCMSTDCSSVGLLKADTTTQLIIHRSKVRNKSALLITF